MPVTIGTSGWQYRDWRGVLYPEGLAQRRWLGRYVEAFATCENNSAFYRLPSRETFASWRAQLPGDFTMAVKTSRFLTHIKRLRDAEEPVQRFLDAAAGLGDRLGPVLVQLPPTMDADPARLDACLALFPDHVRVAVEFRHDSWWTDDVRAILTAHGAALCWADVRGRPRSPLWRTAAWAYLRMHQGMACPRPHYGDQAMRTWVRRLCGTWPENADVYVYFNNDPGGAAVRNAVRFAELTRAHGRVCTRTPRLGD
ncbi:DUF72 domain-containing protein [Phytoactinopolyspora alkaliphila]|uniref:DUF72 domain-containing protein n=1 Tax=Phytoactinopolyspora alkaliphila TaxID=1783498 RepID=A0A6N9YQT0_9ACTN|nr:DUF72 domain-containing protein [Phytoactinopolyspora alkaliphila]NED97373.1 DUF72 domain-containing protein [Phytoactinopolyspora alkaliphila]